MYIYIYIDRQICIHNSNNDKHHCSCRIGKRAGSSPSSRAADPISYMLLLLVVLMVCLFQLFLVDYFICLVICVCCYVVVREVRWWKTTLGLPTSTPLLYGRSCAYGTPWQVQWFVDVLHISICFYVSICFYNILLLGCFAGVTQSFVDVPNRTVHPLPASSGAAPRGRRRIGII